MFSTVVRADAVRAACAVVIVGLTSSVAHAQPSRTARDGVYSDAQATRGGAIYKDQCASCHGPSLGGSLAPPLAGDRSAGVNPPSATPTAHLR